MSREILFKAKRKNWKSLSKEKWWIEGALLPSDDGSYISISFLAGKEKMPVVVSAACEIDPETVCQYIGKTDKRGKKIFENDIIFYKVLGSDEEGYTIGRVKWFEEKMCFAVPRIEITQFWNVLQDCLVVGSYFDEEA